MMVNVLAGTHSDQLLEAVTVIVSGGGAGKVTVVGGGGGGQVSCPHWVVCGGGGATEVLDQLFQSLSPGRAAAEAAATKAAKAKDFILNY